MPVVPPVEATEDELLASSCKSFLPESEVSAGDGFGIVAASEAAGRLLLAGGGDRKEEGLVAPKTAPSVGCRWPCSCSANHVPATPSLQAWQTETTG